MTSSEMSLLHSYHQAKYGPSHKQLEHPVHLLHRSFKNYFLSYVFKSVNRHQRVVRHSEPAYQLFNSDIQVSVMISNIASYTKELDTKTYVIMLNILFPYLIENGEAREILFHPPVPCPFCHVRTQAVLARAKCCCLDL